MGSVPPESLIRESLPVAAQWGLLGVLLFFCLVAIIYLVNKVFTISDAHRAEITALHVQHAIAMAAVQEKRLREAAEYAAVLAELGEVLAANTEDQQDIAKLLAERSADQPPDTRSPRQRGGSTRS
jgi:hypothetical protein